MLVGIGMFTGGTIWVLTDGQVSMGFRSLRRAEEQFVKVVLLAVVDGADVAVGEATIPIADPMAGQMTSWRPDFPSGSGGKKLISTRLVGPSLRANDRLHVLLLQLLVGDPESGSLIFGTVQKEPCGHESRSFTAGSNRLT